MITARMQVDRVDGKNVRDVKNFKFFLDMEWEDEEVNVFKTVEMAVSLEPFSDNIAVTSGKKCIQTWTGVPCCWFLDMLGKYNRDGKLIDVFFEDERGAENNGL